ncbi:MAG: hypothetical protein AB1540_11430 [Bdellovibrionota bacterium]
MKHSLLFVLLMSVAVVSCGKKKKASSNSYEFEPEHTLYKVHCVTEPTPSPSPRAAPNSVADPDLPESLPEIRIPIEVEQCSGLGGVPHFNNKEMPGLIAIVDCNSRAVRFKTRDYRVNEVTAIGPTGEFHARVMYMNRLAVDSQGNANCWTRLLGDLSGRVSCPGDPAGARMDLEARWSFDETPPEVMEPPTPGQADFRNGKHCELLPGNCSFVNRASIGCGG